MIAATIASAPVASHTGRKRAATTALATNARPGTVKGPPFRGRATVRGLPRPDAHFVQVQPGVSTVVKRHSRIVRFRTSRLDAGPGGAVPRSVEAVSWRTLTAVTRRCRAVYSRWTVGQREQSQGRSF